MKTLLKQKIINDDFFVNVIISSRMILSLLIIVFIITVFFQHVTFFHKIYPSHHSLTNLSQSLNSQNSIYRQVQNLECASIVEKNQTFFKCILTFFPTYHLAQTTTRVPVSQLAVAISSFSFKKVKPTDDPRWTLHLLSKTQISKTQAFQVISDTMNFENNLIGTHQILNTTQSDNLNSWTGEVLTDE